jgi:hypothetical protein
MLRSWLELRDARRKGRRDGRAGVPTLDQDALPFSLREILARAGERVHRLILSWTHDARALEAELADLAHRTASAEARLADAEMQHGAALGEHERRKQDEDEHLAALQGRLEDLPTAEPVSLELDEPPLPALETLSPIANAPPRIEISSSSAPERAPALELGNTSERGMGPLAYWALVILIVVGEIPLNAFAFRLFHEPDLLTYAMTVTVAVALVAMAHVVGLLLSRPQRAAVERVVVTICIGVPFAVISAVALVRYGYLQDVGGDSGIGPILGTLAFGSINLLVFGAAVGSSYLHHDPRTFVNRRASVRAAEKERARVERRSSEEELARMRRTQRLEDEARQRSEDAYHRQVEAQQERRRQEFELLTSQRQAEIEVHRSEVLARREQIAEAMRPIRETAHERAERLAELGSLVHEARASVASLKARVQAIEAELRALQASTDAAIQEVRAGRDRLVFAWCSANVRARRGHGSPRCFEHVPPLEIPSGFDAAMAEASR